MSRMVDFNARSWGALGRFFRICSLIFSTSFFISNVYRFVVDSIEGPQGGHRRLPTLARPLRKGKGPKARNPKTRTLSHICQFVLRNVGGLTEEGRSAFPQRGTTSLQKRRLVPGPTSLVPGFLSLVSGIVSRVSGIVSLVSAFVFWVSGLVVFGVSTCSSNV